MARKWHITATTYAASVHGVSSRFLTRRYRDQRDVGGKTGHVDPVGLRLPLFATARLGGCAQVFESVEDKETDERQEVDPHAFIAELRGLGQGVTRLLQLGQRMHEHIRRRHAGTEGDGAPPVGGQQQQRVHTTADDERRGEEGNRKAGEENHHDCAVVATRQHHII